MESSWPFTRLGLGRQLAGGLLTLLLTQCHAPGMSTKNGGRATMDRPSGNGRVAGQSTSSLGIIEESAIQLTVNAESIGPDQMWRELAPDLVAMTGGLPAEDARRRVEERAARWLHDKIAEMLLHQRAVRKLAPGQLSRVDQIVDADLRETITRDHDGVQRKYEKYLGGLGLTLDDVRNLRRRAVTISGFMETHVRPYLADATREELAEVFEASRNRLTRSPRRRMSLIEIREVPVHSTMTTRPTLGLTGEVLPNPGDPRPLVESPPTQRVRAEDALQALRSGESFADVARRYSDDSRAPEGGDWGWVTPEGVRDRYRPALDRLFTMEPGETSDLISTPDAVFIVRCEEVDPGGSPSFAEIQTELIERFRREALNRRIGELVDDLQRQARIEPRDLSTFHASTVEATLRHLFNKN